MFQPWPEPTQHTADPGATRGLAIGEFDATVMAHLEHHIAEEGALLAEYQHLLRDTDSAPVRYLLGLLFEDEQRHHRVLTEMLNQFRTSVFLVEQRPHVPWMTRSENPALAAATRRLRRAERKDLRQLRALRRRLKFMRRHSLNGVLVDSMILDTRKHLRYLRTIKRLV